MPEVPFRKILGYLAVGLVLLLIGWSSLRPEGPARREVLVNGSQEGSTAPQEVGEGSGLRGAGAGGRLIVVDVSGAVRRPGVYRFQHGQRVIDAIRKAGGPGPGAFAAGINRAAKLSDGQQVVVPSRAVAAAAARGGAVDSIAGLPGGAGESEASPPISLGSATLDELDQVSGIGPVTMEALRSRLQP